jgi:hypothetical protein
LPLAEQIEKDSLGYRVVLGFGLVKTIFDVQLRKEDAAIARNGRNRRHYDRFRLLCLQNLPLPQKVVDDFGLLLLFCA